MTDHFNSLILQLIVQAFLPDLTREINYYSFHIWVVERVFWAAGTLLTTRAISGVARVTAHSQRFPAVAFRLHIHSG